MLTNVRKGIMYLDRGSYRCMHYHGLCKQWMERRVFYKKNIYSRDFRRYINMRPRYPHKTHYVGWLKTSNTNSTC